MVRSAVSRRANAARFAPVALAKSSSDFGPSDSRFCDSKLGRDVDHGSDPMRLYQVEKRDW